MDYGRAGLGIFVEPAGVVFFPVFGEKLGIGVCKVVCEIGFVGYFGRFESFSGFGIDDVMKSVRHPALNHRGTNREVAELLAANLKKGDVVVTLSAGDANQAAPMALEMLKNAEH